MTDINNLINLSIELEGLLKVISDRESINARQLLAEKFRLYSDGIQQLLAETAHLGEPAEEPVETETIAGTESSDEAVEEEKKEEETPAEPEEEHKEEMPLQLQQEQSLDDDTPEEKPADNINLATAFTLNDKFRFRRELFNGDIEDFADTLALLAQMPSYDEAVDYLTNDLLWDTRNPAVEEFFDILKKAFNNH